MTGKAIIFSAPSGAGKTTIVRYLLASLPDLQFSISATTRPKRDYETDGKDYYFLSLSQFEQRVAHGDLLEWQEVYPGVKYGTLRQEVERIWKEGKTVIFDVDVVGGVNLKKELGEKALAVFIRVKDVETLRQRLTNRKTESAETLEMRVGKALREMAYEQEFDVVIVNDELEQAQQEAITQVTKFLKS